MFQKRALLAALVLFAFALRCSGFEYVFVDDGDVVFYLGDAYFHVYRALATLTRFPGFLGFDTYLNFPDGAAVPSPPGYDLLAAAITLGFGGSQWALERVSALLPTVLGAATVLPVYALGARIGGTRTAWVAALLIAVMPANAVYSLLGYADHHAAVAFLVACWIALAVSIAADAGSLALRCAALALVRTAVLWTWSGSLLYLAIGDVSLVIALVATRAGAAPLAGVGLSVLASAAATVPIVAISPLPIDGALSAIMLSWLQPLACAAIAVWCALLALLARRGANRSALRRCTEAIGLGVAIAALLLAIPALRTNLVAGLAFVASLDDWSYAVIEQLPLFSRIPGAVSATMLFGWLAYAVILAPLLALTLASTRAMRGPGIVLLAWSTALAGLTLMQNRFACDFSVVGAVLFADFLVVAVGALGASGARERLALPAAIALAAILLLPAAQQLHLPRIEGSIDFIGDALRGTTAPRDRALDTVHGTALRFAQQVRLATPETSGYLQDEPRPEYGVLCDPGLGYTIEYTARRPTPASGAGPYVGAANAFATQRFFQRENESEAVAIASQLHARFVVTEGRPDAGARTLMRQLHEHDGAAAPRWEQFRLVTEGPAGGTPFLAVIGDLSGIGEIPFKLFEIVPGAVLDVPAAPGTPVTARVVVQTPTGRTFPYRAEAVAGDDGRARLRVPYATRTSAPTRTTGPWQVQAGGASWEVDVEDADVERGSAVLVSAPRRSDGAGHDDDALRHR